MPSLEARIEKLEQVRNPREAIAIFRSVLRPGRPPTPLMRMTCQGIEWAIRDGETEGDFKQRAAREAFGLGIKTPRFVQVEGAHHGNT